MRFSFIHILLAFTLYLVESYHIMLKKTVNRKKYLESELKMNEVNNIDKSVKV